MDNNERYIKRDVDGFYHLIEKHDSFESYADNDGCLGTGGGMKITRFQSAEGREYYIMNEGTKRALRSVERDLRYLRQEVRELVGKTGRVSRKRVLQLVESVNKQK